MYLQKFKTLVYLPQKRKEKAVCLTIPEKLCIIFLVMLHRRK